MTISILAYDEKTGTYGGAAATGSLCVGGWVLRGDAESGISASQGSLPSTMWGDRALALMKAGHTAADTVASLTGPDAGRMHRQMAALDLRGGTAHFTGSQSIPAAGARGGPAVVVTGNMLADLSVLDAALHAFGAVAGPLPDRLLTALEAADAAGGDARGFLSAALLVVSRATAPLTLRIDKSDRPLAALRDLYTCASTGPYADWAAHVPTLDDPERATPYLADARKA